MTYSNQNFIRALSKELGKSTKDVDTYLSTFQDILERALLEDKIVKINGLGSFKLLWNKPRKSVNVRTGESMEIPGHYKLNFIPDVAFKKLVNSPYAHLEVLHLEEEITYEEPPCIASESERFAKMIVQANELSVLLAGISTSQASIVEKGAGEFSTLANIDVLEDKEPIENLEQSDDIGSLYLLEKEDEPLLGDCAEVAILQDEEQEELQEEQVISLGNICTLPDHQTSEDIEDTLDSNDVEHNKDLEEIFISDVNIFGTADLENKETNISKKSKWKYLIQIFVLLICSVPLYFFITNGSSRDMSFFNSSSNVRSTEIDSEKPTLIREDHQDTLQGVNQIEKPKMKVNTKGPLVITAQLNSSFGNSFFDKERIYTEFSDTIALSEGSRLSWISYKRFKHKYFWVYIYEANMDHIQDPNNIAVGTAIRIPVLPSEIIDANNTECLIYAKELHEYYIDHL